MSRAADGAGGMAGVASAGGSFGPAGSCAATATFVVTSWGGVLAAGAGAPSGAALGTIADDVLIGAAFGMIADDVSAGSASGTMAGDVSVNSGSPADGTLAGALILSGARSPRNGPFGAVDMPRASVAVVGASTVAAKGAEGLAASAITGGELPISALASALGGALIEAVAVS